MPRVFLVEKGWSWLILQKYHPVLAQFFTVVCWLNICDTASLHLLHPSIQSVCRSSHLHLVPLLFQSTGGRTCKLIYPYLIRVPCGLPWWILPWKVGPQLPNLKNQNLGIGIMYIVGVICVHGWSCYQLWSFDTFIGFCNVSCLWNVAMVFELSLDVNRMDFIHAMAHGSEHKFDGR